MRVRFWNFSILTLVLLALGALPASANHLDRATATADCSSFTIRIEGSDLHSDLASVRYSLVLTPDSGSPITFAGEVPVTANPDFTFSAVIPGTFNGTLLGHFCLSGSTFLIVDGTWFTPIPIVPTPECMTCSTVCTGTIGDFVWRDSDCDGIQDFGEPGLNGITVYLKKLDGTIVATTTTVPGPALQGGYYQFDHVCLGSYKVVVDGSTLPPGATQAPCLAGSDRAQDNNCSPADVSLGEVGSDQTIDFGYCVNAGKSFSIGPSSMEGHLTIRAGDWISGGYSFKFKNAGHAATQFTVSSTASIAVTCPQGGGAGGTIVVDLGTKTFAVPAGNTNWLPTGDANSVLSWMGAAQAPDLCGGRPMDNARGAVYKATVSQNPATGSLADFRFKYRDPNAKGKGNVNCLDTSDPRRAKADVCGASWSQTVLDP